MSLGSPECSVSASGILMSSNCDKLGAIKAIECATLAFSLYPTPGNQIMSQLIGTEAYCDSFLHPVVHLRPSLWAPSIDYSTDFMTLVHHHHHQPTSGTTERKRKKLWWWMRAIYNIICHTTPQLTHSVPDLSRRKASHCESVRLFRLISLPSCSCGINSNDCAIKKIVVFRVIRGSGFN